MSYEPGDAVHLTWSLDDPLTRDEQGRPTPVGGATVTLTVQPPGADPIDVPVVETSPGRWSGTVTVTEPVGYWAWLWRATGVAGAADSGRFHVQAHAQPRHA